MNDLHNKLGNQSHILKWYNELTSIEKNALNFQINSIDVKQLENLLKNALIEEKREINYLEQISLHQQINSLNLSLEEIDCFRLKGFEAISKGEVALITLAGGQASRIGTLIPKGTINLNIGFSKTDSLFFIQCARLCRLIKLSKSLFPNSQPSIKWLIMVSQSTLLKTREHIAEVIKETEFSKDDILIFIQNEIPTLSFNGNLLMKSKSVILTNPDGSGGIFEALAPHMNWIKSKNLKYFQVGAIDNILNKVADPVFVGATIFKNADCCVKIIEKSFPSQAVGNLCLINKQVECLEYSEISKELAERRDLCGKLYLRLGSIGLYLFNINFLKEICCNLATNNLPFHIAKKNAFHISHETGKLIESDVFKLERFIFDSFKYAKNFFTFQVLADEEFSPLKNSNDKKTDCLDTCLNNLSANNIKWLKSTTILNDIKFDGKIFISPLISYFGEDLKENAFELNKKIKNIIRSDSNLTKIVLNL